MTWPGLTQDVECLCSTCQVCQLTKKERKKYGLLPPKIAESDPWVMVCVDLVGPLRLLKPLISRPVPSRICFIIPGWRVILVPQNIVFDNGGKFKREFKKMCDSYGIKAKPTTSHNS